MEKEDQGDKDTEENFLDAITYFGKKFNITLKNMNRKQRINVKTSSLTLIPRARA